MNFMQNPDMDGQQFELIGNTDVAVVLIHGFTATTVEVRPLAEALNSEGISVFAPLLPGHNTSPEDLNGKKWKDWTKWVEEVSTPLFDQYAHVFIGGESMGGLVSLYVASQHPRFRGIMLYSPAILIDQLGYVRIMRLIKKTMPKRNSEPDGLAKPGEFRWKGYRVNPTRAAYQLFLLQQKVKQRLARIHHPLLIFQGALDQTINPLGAKLIYDQVRSKEKELVNLENSGHCVILEKEHDLVFQKTLSFIQSHLKSVQD